MTPGAQGTRVVRETQHARLARELRDRILDGTYPVGSRLPTESDLCRAHELSRGTVRVALRSLEDEGLINRRPGAGTMVISRQSAEDYVPLVSTRDEIVSIYRNTRVARPSTRSVRVDAELAARMGVVEGTRWLLVEGARRLRSRPQGPPLCWTEHYIRPDSPDYDPDHSDTHAATMPADRIEQTVRAVPLPERFADELQATASAPALVIERRHLDAEGQLISASFHTHPGDRFAISTRFVPDGPA